MAYWDISQMAGNGDLQQRAVACVAQEQPGDPYAWMAANMIRLAAQPGWDAAWASAVAAGNPAPGRDEAVITDGMILSGVQALLAVP